jgi:hypothetical protein
MIPVTRRDRIATLMNKKRTRFLGSLFLLMISVLRGWSITAGRLIPLRPEDSIGAAMADFSG